MDNAIRIEHEIMMREALVEAEKAGERGDLAIGAVLVYHGEIIGRGSNRRNTYVSKVHHAENMVILENATFLKEHKRECVLYSTLEPCFMCLSTAVIADISDFVFGVVDQVMNLEQIIQSVPYLNHRVHTYIPDILRNDCMTILVTYNAEFAEAILTQRSST